MSEQDPDVFGAVVGRRPVLTAMTMAAAMSTLLAGGALRGSRPAAAEEAPAGNPGWVTFRRFALAEGVDRAELVASTLAEFDPVVPETDGFVAYAVFQPDPRSWAAFTLWRDKEAAAAALPMLRSEWLEEHAGDLTGEADGFEATVDIAAGHAAMVDPEGRTGEWFVMRTYQLKPDADRAALIAETEASFLPLLESLEGWHGFYVLRPAEDVWAAATVWTDEASSTAGAAKVKAWVAEHVSGSVASGPEMLEGPVDLTILAAGAPSQATPEA